MLWAGRIIAGLWVMTYGYAWTVGQSGLPTVDRNLCELWDAILWKATECHPHTFLLPLWGIGAVVAAIFLVTDFVRARNKAERPKLETFLWVLLVSGVVTAVASGIGLWRIRGVNVASAAETPMPAPPSVPPSQSPPTSPTPPPVINQEGGEAHLKDIQTNGAGTFLNQKGGTIFIEGGTATFPGAKFPVVPLTQEQNSLSNEQIRELLRSYTKSLTAFDDRYEKERSDANKRASLEDEFKSIYVPQGRTIQSLIVSKTKADPDDLPDGPTASTPNDLYRMYSGSFVRLGRSSLGHGKLLGSPTYVIKYLNFLAEKLPP